MKDYASERAGDAAISPSIYGYPPAPTTAESNAKQKGAGPVYNTSEEYLLHNEQLKTHVIIS
jgi:hypothetical protein